MDEFTEISPILPEDAELMPWWLGRMCLDNWSFGLLLVTNQVACIEGIDRVWRDRRGSIWIDVTLSSKEPQIANGLKQTYLRSPTSRPKATINTDHVVAAFDLAES